MNNSYNIAAFWSQSDGIIRTVALLLLIMSIITWYVIVLKSWQLVKLRKQALIAGNNFWHAKNLPDGLLLLGDDRESNPFLALAEDAANAASHHADGPENLHSALNVSEWITSCLRHSINNITSNMQRGLPILASIGSTTPFIGLFGTVWGIYHALVGIGMSNQTSINQIAIPVGEALIMTALGLVVAIPAVLGYNALARSNKALLSELHSFAHDLHAYFVTGSRIDPRQHKKPKQTTQSKVSAS